MSETERSSVSPVYYRVSWNTHPLPLLTQLFYAIDRCPSVAFEREENPVSPAGSEIFEFGELLGLERSFEDFRAKSKLGAILVGN